MSMYFRRRGNKYGAQKITVGGESFDSLLEERVYRQYLLPRSKSEGGKLERQIEFPIELNGKLVARYIADFVYTLNNQRTIYECKGIFVGDAKMKLRCVQAIYDIPIVIIYSLSRMESLGGYRKQNKAYDEKGRGGVLKKKDR